MTEKFVPYEKLSKKKQKELDRSRRLGWGTIDPVTRRKESAKTYNRKKLQRIVREEHGRSFFVRRDPVPALRTA